MTSFDRFAPGAKKGKGQRKTYKEQSGVHLKTNSKITHIKADSKEFVTSEGDKISDIETTLTMELSAVHEWLVENKLSLHLGKTERILFASKRRLHTYDKLNVICYSTPISSKSSVNVINNILE